MKILLDHSTPFLLAHGGFQIQIEQTKLALDRIGVHTEYLRWWDDKQTGDIIHYFGRPSVSYTTFAHQKGLKVVYNTLHGGLGARPAWKRLLQKASMIGAERVLRLPLRQQLSWDAYLAPDACIALTKWEAHLIHWMFEVPQAKIHVVPNGVEDVFHSKPESSCRNEWLVTTASILPVKRLIETAQAAVLAKTPYWVIGRPFSEEDPYFRRFVEFFAQHPDLLRYTGPVTGREEMASIYREARGFVLLSRWETLSLSALEASGCGCPLFLRDLPWARNAFSDNDAFFCPVTESIEKTARHLRAFYDAAPTLPTPPKPLSWNQVAEQLKGIYLELLSTSR